jgi:hypothetical protein
MASNIHWQVDAEPLPRRGDCCGPAYGATQCVPTEGSPLASRRLHAKGDGMAVRASPGGLFRNALALVNEAERP